MLQCATKDLDNKTQIFVEISSFKHQWKRDFNLPVPTRRTVDNLLNKWEMTGIVIEAPRSGRPLSIRTEENHELVKNHYEDHPETSTRQGSS